MRLSRGVLELYAVGMKNPMQIGLLKGVPRTFIKQVHHAVLERLHHTKHNLPLDILSTMEFPLESSTILKEYLREEKSELLRRILMIMDEKSRSQEEIYFSLLSFIPEPGVEYELEEISHEKIKIALSELQKKGFIQYNVKENTWGISKPNSKSEELQKSKEHYDQIYRKKYKDILNVLKDNPLRAEDLCRIFTDLGHDEIDKILTELQNEGIIRYRITDDKWEVTIVSEMDQNS